MADKVVVDTSFLIELLDRGRRDLVEYIIDKEVLIPFVVLYEYLYGYRVIGRDVSRRKRILEDLGTIVWVDQDLLLKLIGMRYRAEEKGQKIPEADLIILATASIHHAPILTLDKAHFTRQGITDVEIIIPRQT